MPSGRELNFRGYRPVPTDTQMAIGELEVLVSVTRDHGISSRAWAILRSEIPGLMWRPRGGFGLTKSSNQLHASK